MNSNAQIVSREVVTDPIRVMVVDDSVVIRGLISRWIDEERETAVVATHRNGKLAVEDMERADPDVVILDIEMPEMDGLTALPLMLRKKPSLTVIMASTLTRRNAEISLKALSLGASDYIPKPERNSAISTSADFRREILEKVRVLGRRHRLRRNAMGRVGERVARPVPRSVDAGRRPIPVRETATKRRAGAGAAGSMEPRPISAARPRVLAIGSSTGGPQALAELFAAIGPALGAVPVLVVQHMPETFTAILAEHIGKTSGRPAAEAREGEVLQPGRVYVAPGGRHMLLDRAGAGAKIRLDDGPAINFCKPAVDPLFRSVAEVYGRAALGVVLTGMGSDGAKGAVAIADGGGTVLAQDEATSVVWGMPGAAAQAGACAAVLPLDGIGRKIVYLLGGEGK